MHIAYGPTNNKSGDVQHEFNKRLDKTYGECPKHDVIFIICDANAQVGRKVIGKKQPQCNCQS